MRRFYALLQGAVVAALCSTAALAVEGAATAASAPVLPSSPPRSTAPAQPMAVARPPAAPKVQVTPKPPLQPPPRGRQSFADMVRELVAKGEVRPLKDVLDVVRKTGPGEIVSVKLRHMKPRWVYHVRVVQNGRRTDLDIDGKSLKVLERK